MIIRWLGAFGKEGNLNDSLNWEFTQADRRALAAEKLQKGKSFVQQSKIGLLVKNSAVLRRYRSDVWSVYDEQDGLLKKTRSEFDSNSHHTECFIRPEYIGIVVKAKISETALQAVKSAADRYNVPVLRLTRDGRLLPHT